MSASEPRRLTLPCGCAGSCTVALVADWDADEVDAAHTTVDLYEHVQCSSHLRHHTSERDTRREQTAEPASKPRSYTIIVGGRGGRTGYVARIYDQDGEHVHSYEGEMSMRAAAHAAANHIGAIESDRAVRGGDA